MKHFVDLAMMDRLDQLIRMKNTGTPYVLANRLGISQSVLSEYIAYMQRMLNAQIKYNAYTQTYEYVRIPDYYLGFEKDRSKAQ